MRAQKCSFGASRGQSSHVIFEQDRSTINRNVFPARLDLQLALHTSHLHQRPTIAQDNLTILVLGDEANFLEAISVYIARAPDLSGELVPRADGRCEASLELLEIFRVATTKLPQNTVGGGVPAKEAVDDSATEAHLLTGHGVGVERVVVTVQTSVLSVGGFSYAKEISRTYRYRWAVSMLVCTTWTASGFLPSGGGKLTVAGPK